MKTLFNCILALVLATSNLIAGGPTTMPIQVLDQNIDSVNTARALVLRPADNYRFRVYLYTDFEGDKPTDQMEGEMLPDGRIASLTVNETLIVDQSEPPLLNLPLPKEKDILYIYISMSGYAGGEQVTTGYYESSQFKRGDALVVTMYPVQWRGFVSHELPAGLDPKNFEITFSNGGGWGYYYDEFFGGFIVYINPSYAHAGYVIRDNRTGIIVGRGVVTAFDPFPVGHADEPTESPFSVVYGNGVVDAQLDKEGTYFIDQQLDGQTVNADGTVTPAKVYFTAVDGDMWPHFFIRGIEGKIEIYEATESKTMPLLHQQNSEVNVGDGMQIIRVENLHLKAGMKLVIKVTGRVLLRNGFTAIFYKTTKG